jgi:membrane protein YdbS with pleckstrin-like domain
MTSSNHQKQKMLAQFWSVHAPLIVLSAAIMWGVWFVLVGNTWPAWVAAMVPILGGIAHIYPRRQK